MPYSFFDVREFLQTRVAKCTTRGRGSRDSKKPYFIGFLAPRDGWRDRAEGVSLLALTLCPRRCATVAFIVLLALRDSRRQPERAASKILRTPKFSRPVCARSESREVTTAHEGVVHCTVVSLARVLGAGCTARESELTAERFDAAILLGRSRRRW
jgi:hypothetical protein